VNERNAMDLKSGYSRPQHVGYSRNLFLIYKLIFIGTGIESVDPPIDTELEKIPSSLDGYYRNLFVLIKRRGFE
jgi:hypothetical protein